MPNLVRRFFKKLGPGFITGASDDDPSGIATYTQAGAQFGYGQLWTAFITLPFMYCVQEMSARIGLVAGEGISSVVRKHYPKWLLWIFILLILVANTINIGADLGAMASATRLLLPGMPFAVLAIGCTALILFLEVFITYRTYAEILKWLAMTLVCYLLTLVIVTEDWRGLFLHAFLPTVTFSRDYILMLVAVLGTTISPYLFIWQSNEEVEEQIAKGLTTIEARRGASTDEVKAMRVDTAAGMAFSNVMTFCILGVAAAVFFRHGITNIETAADAAQALEPLAGRFASLLFTFGIIGTGLLAVPILSSSASYALSEALGWKDGLYKKFADARGFYAIIAVSTLVGLVMNFIGVSPIKALIWAAVLNGSITPPLLLIILLIANNKKIMGRHVNSRLANFAGITTLVVMAVAVFLLFVL